MMGCLSMNWCLFERGRGRGSEGISSRLHIWGSIPQPWGHDLGRNQELGTQPTESPRHPMNQ